MVCFKKGNEGITVNGDMTGYWHQGVPTEPKSCWQSVGDISGEVQRVGATSYVSWKVTWLYWS